MPYVPSHKQYSKKFTSRNSPPYPAKHFASGISKKGNDGTMYVVSRPNINGIKRWLKKTLKRRPSSSAVTEVYTRDTRDTSTRDTRRRGATHRGATPPVNLQPSFHREFSPPPPASTSLDEVRRSARAAVRARQEERVQQIRRG